MMGQTTREASEEGAGILARAHAKTGETSSGQVTLKADAGLVYVRIERAPGNARGLGLYDTFTVTADEFRKLVSLAGHMLARGKLE